jgi:hypothetical protein
LALLGMVLIISTPFKKCSKGCHKEPDSFR